MNILDIVTISVKSVFWLSTGVYLLFFRIDVPSPFPYLAGLNYQCLQFCLFLLLLYEPFSQGCLIYHKLIVAVLCSASLFRILGFWQTSEVIV